MRYITVDILKLSISEEPITCRLLTLLKLLPQSDTKIEILPHKIRN